MCEKLDCDDIKDLSYYWQHRNDIKTMSKLIRCNHELYSQLQRLIYIDSFKNKDKIYVCPECRSSIVSDEWGEEYCSNCGLVTRTHYQYTAGQRLVLDYGLK